MLIIQNKFIFTDCRQCWFEELKQAFLVCLFIILDALTCILIINCYLIVSEYVTNIFWSRAPSKPAASLQPNKGDIQKEGSEERKEVSGVLQPTPKQLLDHQLEPMRYFHFVQRLQYVIYVTFIWMQASSRPPVVLHPMSISCFCNSDLFQG